MTDNIKFESIKSYLKYHLSSKDSKSRELEIRFGTNNNNRLSKINYDNIIKSLHTHGFTSIDTIGSHVLKVSEVKSNIRTEIYDLHYILEYCKSNDLISLIKNNPENIKFQEKTQVIHNITEKPIPVFDNKDFNFRIAYNNEITKTIEDADVISFVSNSKSSRNFRLMNRITFTHTDIPVKIDCSVVKYNTLSNSITFKDSKILENTEIYEVEIEIDNERVFKYELNQLHTKINKCIMYILSGIQESFYPIPNSVSNTILNEYKKLISTEYPLFCGPSSVTLQLQHLLPDNQQNVLQNYTITDKADGLRKLLYISSGGKLYYISTNMQLQYCGVTVSDNSLFGTLIDGEHILYDKYNNFLNLFAVFDCYYLNYKSSKDLPLYTLKDGKPGGRLSLLLHITQKIKNSISNDKIFSILCKTFRIIDESTTLFDECKIMFEAMKDSDKFNYNIDGLILTPANLAVGANSVGQSAKHSSKFTWNRSFKWKPPEYNTIDFMVTFPRTNKSNNVIHNTDNSIYKYKAINLRVGYSTKRHGYLNPFKDVIDGNFNRDQTEKQDYEPALFYPTNPYDNQAHICHIQLKLDSNGIEQMFTEEGEIFSENMIVEFKYIASNESFMKWVPLKVRYDKTYDLLKTGKNFGNAYHVANNNWHSIHQPVTEDILKNGLVQDNLLPENQDVYYNTSHKKSNIAYNLRNFHNRLKSALISYATQTPDSTLLDIAVGKGGDMRKWCKNKKIKFVLGIDISIDNIENKVDGACKRYLDEKNIDNDIVSAIFIPGDSSKNIRDGSSYSSSQIKSISDGIFGVGSKSPSIIGNMPSKYFGIASNGFNIVSCQFALHYFFKNKETLKNLIINLVECTALNGLFIGTCYNGSKVFDLLKNTNNAHFSKNNELILNITKKYSNTHFIGDESSLGYAIDVFQESINKVTTEYLVNFEFFIRIMQNYGFVPEVIDKDPHFKYPIADFESYYEVNNITDKKFEMSHEERSISFLNNYFIFKKVRHANINDVVWDNLDSEVPDVPIKHKTVKIKTKRTKEKV
jgi:hypothetical protein